MDQVIAKFPYLEDGDLNLCLENGVAYQRDMTNIINYDENYFNNYVSRSGTEIANKLNKGRIAFVEKYFNGELLDVGIGSGEFIQSRPATFGYDVNQVAINWLLEKGLYRDDFSQFSGFTFWDVIEHIRDPDQYFMNIWRGSWIFTSIPVFDDLTRIRESKHYKPGEHLYYFTIRGFIEWMSKHCFKGVGTSTFEMAAGREGIQSFAFRKIWPD